MRGEQRTEGSEAAETEAARGADRGVGGLNTSRRPKNRAWREQTVKGKWSHGCPVRAVGRHRRDLTE